MCSPKLASSWCFAFQGFQGCLPCGPTWATMRHNRRVPSSMHYEHEHVASCELLLQFITAFDSTIAAVASLLGPMSWVVTEVNAQCFYMSFAIEKEVRSSIRMPAARTNECQILTDRLLDVPQVSSILTWGVLICRCLEATRIAQ